MAKKKNNEVVNIIENIDIHEEKKVEKPISLVEFIEKYNITGFLRRAYIKKFAPDQKFLESEWLKK